MLDAVFAEKFGVKVARLHVVFGQGKQVLLFPTKLLAMYSSSSVPAGLVENVFA